MRTTTTASTQGQLYFDEPLAKYTSWRVGGPAKQLYKPESVSDLACFLAQLPPDEPLLWLGLGSNTLVRDDGFAGTVVLTQGCLKAMTRVDDQHVRVEAGVSCASMARFCARHGLAGAEFWAGIPGTMGGALRMNAGCHQGETWQFVKEVSTITRNGALRTRSRDEFDIGYRHLGQLGEEWFLSAVCGFEAGDKDASLATIKTLLARRAETQPTGEFSCGSVFRNPPNQFAAQLIESCGLKGYRIGHAVVSQKHANFIINEAGLAKAADIEALIDHVAAVVHQKTGVLLSKEVHILGGCRG